MVEMISALIAFVISQYLAHHSPWMKRWSLLTMMGMATGIIGISIIVFVIWDAQFLSIVVVPTVVSATFLSAKFRLHVTKSIKREETKSGT
ncbi:hypothetical protein GXN76_01385 [Kroppenstedtia pulmonis]|uniref:Uncharacterized protein n=1 Tax=Kroppenstedtia pulmonis TaxID=1380685 RepID=A0A7D4B0W4_9BACL|nr:hypothetical protein [Kroppenstedtia pulmonis]QKG83246.1 hypothetical protein GXN76_01385 [Kroppenstedtia pulmonis]